MAVKVEPKAALSRAGGKRCWSSILGGRCEMNKREWMLRRVKVRRGLLGGNRALVRG